MGKVVHLRTGYDQKMDALAGRLSAAVEGEDIVDCVTVFAAMLAYGLSDEKNKRRRARMKRAAFEFIDIILEQVDEDAAQ